MSLFLGDPSPTVGLKLSTLTYEKSIRSTITNNGIVDATGIATIAAFVAVQSSFVFEEGWDIRMMAATPNIIRYTFKGGDKSLVANYGGPVTEGVGGIGVRVEAIIASGVNITLPHNDANFFVTAIHVGGTTTLDNISALTETGLTGSLKITNVLGNSFIIGAALSSAKISGFFNNTLVEETLEYYLRSGKLYLEWPNSSQVGG